MEFLIIGIVSALNLIVIVHKFKKGRLEDGIFDSILFGLMAIMFSGSYGGMVVAMISSLIISIYLWASPPVFFKRVVSSPAVKDMLNKAKPSEAGFKPFKPRSARRSDEDLHFD